MTADRLIAPIVAPAATVLAIVVTFVCFAAYWH